MKKLDKNVLLETNVVEEERRLLYVAVTRVEERLYIGHKDSKFIKELKEIESILTEYQEWCFNKNFKKLNKRFVFFIFLQYNKINNSFLISKKNVKISKK